MPNISLMVHAKWLNTIIKCKIQSDFEVPHKIFEFLKQAVKQLEKKVSKTIWGKNTPPTLNMSSRKRNVFFQLFSTSPGGNKFHKHIYKLK